MAILRVRDDKGNITDIPAIKGEKGEKGDKGDSAVTDQTYNPTSENAQSGKAVEEAIQSSIDQSADPTSPMAQSGIAVAEAISTVYDDFGTAIEMDYTVRRGDDGIYILLLDLIHEEIKDSTYFLVFEGVIDISVSATLNEIYNIGFALNKKYRIEIRDKKVVSLKVSDKIVDQTYNPESENAQSGKAVNEAIKSNIDLSFDSNSDNAQSGNAVMEAIYKNSSKKYDPTDPFPQSGIAVAQALAAVGDSFVTVADITVEEAVNAITIDETAFPDIGKLKDFYIAFSIAKPETVQSGNLQIKGILQYSTPALGVVKTWNNASYVLPGHFYSKWFEDDFRFNFATEVFSANATTNINLATTVAQIKGPLQGIIIQCATATSLIPVGSKIVIKGIVGK